MNHNQVSGDENPGFVYSLNSPLQTPVSGKSGKTQKMPRTSKANRSASQSAANAGENFLYKFCFEHYVKVILSSQSNLESSVFICQSCFGKALNYNEEQVNFG